MSSLRDAIRNALMTSIILALIFIVYAAQLINGVNAFDPTTKDLLRWGGNLAALTLTGDSWRLLTSVFLHVGLIHLLMNAYFLFAFGPFAERIFGRLNFTVIYLLSGIFGSLLSAYWHGHHTFSRSEQLEMVVSVGASGALMGVAGACFIALFFRDDSQANHEHKNIAQVIGLNLALGFFISGVDQACHIGGLLAGIVFGAICYRPLTMTSRLLSTVRAAILLLVGGALAWQIAQISSTPQLIEYRQQIFSEQNAEKNSPAIDEAPNNQ